MPPRANFRNLEAADFPGGIPRVLQFPSNGEILNAASGELDRVTRTALGLAKGYCPVLTGRLQESIRLTGVNLGSASPSIPAGAEVLKYTDSTNDKINILGRSGGTASIIDRSGNNIRVRITTRYGNLGSSRVAGKVIDRPGRTIWLRQVGSEVPNTAYKSPTVYSGVVSKSVPKDVGGSTAVQTKARWGLVAGGIVVRGRAVYYARDVHDGFGLHANRGPRPFLRRALLDALKQNAIDPRFGFESAPTQVQRAAGLGGAFSSSARFNVGGQQQALTTVLGRNSSYNPLTGGISYRDPVSGRFTSPTGFTNTLRRIQTG